MDKKKPPVSLLTDWTLDKQISTRELGPEINELRYLTIGSFLLHVQFDENGMVSRENIDLALDEYIPLRLRH